MPLRIFRAVKPNLMTQAFDMKQSLVEMYKSLGMTNHGGYDWYTPEGEPLYFDCSCAGYVLNTEIDSAGGLGINIITETEDGIFKHRYWHLKKFNVVAGQKVESGDLIGWCDNTGMSTGSHLHRDMKEMVKDFQGVLKIKNPDNGTYGTVRWDKYFENVFVVDYIKSLQMKIGIIQKIIELWKSIKGR